jgi:hypothetical protein
MRTTARLNNDRARRSPVESTAVAVAATGGSPSLVENTDIWDGDLLTVLKFVLSTRP